MSLQHRFRPATYRTWVRRVLVFAIAAAVGAVGCERSQPHRISVVAFYAVDGDALYAVVNQSEGTKLSPAVVFGCGEPRFERTRSYVYALTYSLGRRESRPTRTRAFEWPVADKDLWASPRRKQLLTMLGVPPKALLLPGASGVKEITEKDLTHAAATALRGLGFKTARLQYCADSANGRWYVGFDPFSPGVQAACPSRALLRERPVIANFEMIWDVDHTRLVMFGDASWRRPNGLAKTVMIWSYVTDTLTEVHLAPPRE